MSPTALPPRHLRALTAALGLLAGCNAIGRTAPLSPRNAAGPPLMGTVHVTSGTFQRRHQVIGVFQMTQEGYRWMHELEVVADADPNSILYKVGAFALGAGAHGVQRLVLVDEKPQTLAEKRMAQVDTALRFAEQMQSRRPPTAASEGTETRYSAKGELVRFLE
jgi:hypothetical protein